VNYRSQAIIREVKRRKLSRAGHVRMEKTRKEYRILMGEI
jgi:hypothetical protein